LVGGGRLEERQRRRVRWRLRQRMADLVVLPSARLRAMYVCVSGVAAQAGDGDAVDGGVDLAVAAAGAASERQRTSGA
jgi:hypothetical protein